MYLDIGVQVAERHIIRCNFFNVTTLQPVWQHQLSKLIQDSVMVRCVAFPIPLSQFFFKSFALLNRTTNCKRKNCLTVCVTCCGDIYTNL